MMFEAMAFKFCPIHIKLSTSNTNGSGHWGRGDYKMGGNQISVKTIMPTIP